MVDRIDERGQKAIMVDTGLGPVRSGPISTFYVGPVLVPT